MKLLLTSAGIKNPTHPGRAGRAARQADRRVRRALHPHRVVRAPAAPARGGVAVHQRQRGRRRRWSGSGGSRSACSSSPRCPASTTSGGSLRSRETDVLLVNGGDAALPVPTGCGSPASPTSSRRCTRPVWVGVSAGSMVMTPRIGEDFKVMEPARRRRHGRSGSSTSRSSRTSTTPTCRRTRWPRRSDWAAGLAEPGVRDRRRHRDQSGRRHASTSSPKGTGSSSPDQEAPSRANSASSRAPSSRAHSRVSATPS